MARAASILSVGLLVGAIFGLYFGWFLYPLELVDVAPLDLDAQYQDEYLRLIATTYAADGDLTSAQQRVQSLGRVDFAGWVMNETLDEIVLDPTSNEAVAMVELAEALGISNPNFSVVNDNNENR